MGHLHERLCQASSVTTRRGSLLRPVGLYIGQLNGELDPRIAPWGGGQCVRIDFNEHDRRIDIPDPGLKNYENVPIK